MGQSGVWVCIPLEQPSLPIPKFGVGWFPCETWTHCHAMYMRWDWGSLVSKHILLNHGLAVEEFSSEWWTPSHCLLASFIYIQAAPGHWGKLQHVWSNSFSLFSGLHQVPQLEIYMIDCIYLQDFVSQNPFCTKQLTAACIELPLVTQFRNPWMIT